MRHTRYVRITSMLENPKDQVEKKSETSTLTKQHTPTPEAVAQQDLKNEITIQAGRLADEAAAQVIQERLGLAKPNSVQAPVNEPPSFTTAEVKTRQDYKDMISVYNQIFTDPTDKDSERTLARLYFSPEIARYFQFKNANNETIGMQLHRINPHIPEAGYTPSGGLLTDYKSLNIYPKMAKLADDQMRQLGVKFMINDCEDPSRIIAANVYPDEKPEEVVGRCERRLNFFRRSMGQFYVNDPEIPYCRPSSENPKEDIQAYDLLGFRPLDMEDTMWKNAFNEDKTMIRKETYGDMYLKLMQLEFGDKNGVPSKEDLRRDYPAIDKFFTNFDKCKKEWVTLHGEQIREKSTPNVGAVVSARDSGTDERMSRGEIERIKKGLSR